MIDSVGYVLVVSLILLAATICPLPLTQDSGAPTNDWLWVSASASFSFWMNPLLMNLLGSDLSQSTIRNNFTGFFFFCLLSEVLGSHVWLITQEAYYFYEGERRRKRSGGE